MSDSLDQNTDELRKSRAITSCFADAARLFGLEVGLKKTEVLHQPDPREEFRPSHNTIGDTELKTTLGYIISSDAKIEKEIDHRLSKANSSFGKLYKRVWNNKNLRNETKISVYRAMVLPISSTARRPGSPTAVTSVSSSDSTIAVSAPSTFTGVTLSHTLRFWSRPRSSVLNPCY